MTGRKRLDFRQVRAARAAALARPELRGVTRRPEPLSEAEIDRARQLGRYTRLEPARRPRP